MRDRSVMESQHCSSMCDGKYSVDMKVAVSYTVHSYHDKNLGHG